MSQHAEPRPDLTPEDILLVVEVADSSVEYDRQVKAPLYARTGVPEPWLVDVGRDHVAVYRDPTSDGYGTTRVLRRGEAISPSAFPNFAIAVADILG